VIDAGAQRIKGKKSLKSRHGSKEKRGKERRRKGRKTRHVPIKVTKKKKKGEGTPIVRVGGRVMESKKKKKGEKGKEKANVTRPLHTTRRDL